MWRYGWLALFLVVPTLHAQRVEVKTPAGSVTITLEESSDRVSTRQIVREILERLEVLEETLEASPRSRRRARELLREIRGLLALLPEDDRVPIVIVPGEDEPRPRKGMVPEAFERLLQQLEDASFADNQIALLKTAATHNTFTAHQARRILEVFDFEEDRLKAAEILAPRIVDRENLHRLYDAFEFSDSREKLQEILEGN